MTFTFSVTAADWGRIAPELVIAGMALLVMLADLLLPRTGTDPKESGAANFYVLPLLALLGIAGAIIATIILFLVGDYQTAFNGMIGSDEGSLYANIIILSASGLGILLSPAYLKRLNLVHQGEYYALMLPATVGMMLMASATSFLMVFLGIEMLSMALYILCGFVTRRRSSQEAGMKYFLLSSFASAFLLYGIALIYGATGKTSFSGVKNFLTQKAVPPNFHSPLPIDISRFTVHGSTLLLIGMGLLTVGFAFKVSAIPFQAWTPDVYDGAPAPVTGFMSVGTKAAALIAFARVFDATLFLTRNDWRPVILVIAILTIIGGNVLAVAQRNVKRLLAYSSIAHAGYLLIGIVASSELIGNASTPSPAESLGRGVGIAAILFYLLCYTFLNLGAFGVVSVLERADNSGNGLDEIRGLWYRQPVLAGLLAFFMLGLAGFPPMAGFAAKYYLFFTALQSGHPELLIIGVLASVLGMYYYLRVIAAMFMEKEKEVAAAASMVPPPPANGGRRPSAKLGTGAKAGAATAVAVKSPMRSGSLAGASPATTFAVEKAAAAPVTIGVMTWIALGITVVGSLAMGTILPFWLVDLAQKAAQMMIR